MNGRLEFFFDFISPNAYLAWHDIRDIAARHDRELVLHPVLFAALLQAHDQRGPAEVEPKRVWMGRNCLRKAAARGIPFRAPASHPFNPLLALRTCFAAETAAQRETVADALFQAAWAQSQDVSDAPTVVRCLDAQGQHGSTLVARAASDDCKRLLRESTEAAIARGVFGVPSMIADDELFFGYEDLPWVERFLAGDDPLDATEAARWLDVRPSAWRRER